MNSSPRRRWLQGVLGAGLVAVGLSLSVLVAPIAVAQPADADADGNGRRDASMDRMMEQCTAMMESMAAMMGGDGMMNADQASE